MNLLLAENLSKTYGEKLLFEEITFGLDVGQKVALIAKNGAGKTTLLNIIMGKDSPDHGQVSFRNNIRIAYLPQNPFLDEDRSILEILFSSENEYLSAIRNYELALMKLKKEDSPDNHKAFEESMGTLDRLHAWDYEAKAKEILGRFNIYDLGQTIRELSGGQKKKLALAKVLIDQVDLLILDEPTNHLDISMIEWLEDYLSREKLSLLLVTHDRYFLDNVCDSILELEDGRLHRYQGNYAYYLEKKAQREYNEGAELERTKAVYRQELEWMRQSPQARTSKSKARIDSFYELQKKATKHSTEAPKELVVQTQRMGGKILEINYLCKSFGSIKVLEDFTHTFKRGEKIGIVGKNGSGKTTFLELIMGRIPADKGRIVKGQTVNFGYFSQDGPTLPSDKRIIDLVREIAEVIPLGKGKEMSASQFLNHFGFNYTTQYNYYFNLSGGEKRKLYLLMTLMGNPNFLLLDEPTNDLDIYTLNLLEDFLIHFDGCVMFVSHDRYFIDKMSDHIFVFEDQGKVKDYYGNYTEYHFKKLKLDAAIKKKKTAAAAKKEFVNEVKNKSKMTFKQKIEFESLDKEIRELEEEKANILRKLNEGAEKNTNLLLLSERYGIIDQLIEGKTLKWLELSELT